MTLKPDEFIRRFLIHVLPCGFHRIRHYGLFANGARADNIARARELLATPTLQTKPDECTRRQRRHQAADPPTSMSMLRRPHDHYRDFQARLDTASSADRSNHRYQDRHVMTTIAVLQQRSDKLAQRRLQIGGDNARADAPSRHLSIPATDTLNKAFGRRPLVYVAPLSLAGIRNPPQKLTLGPPGERRH
jgi:hypothetical protein